MLSKIKLFLRIEPEFLLEDELIQGFIDEAGEYCKNAVGYLPDEDNPIFSKFVMLYVANAYDNRELLSNGYEKTSYNYTPLLNQLRYCYEDE